VLYGIDVSGYQGTSYTTTGRCFVGIKVTEGLSYVNPKWVAQRATARAAGLVQIFYHYPRIAAPNVVSHAAAEADYFLSQINLAPGDVLCLDWEWYGQTVTNQQARDYRDAWLARVRAKASTHKVILYCDASTWKGVDQTSNCGDGLWLADYTTAGVPRISYAWTLHQYTDHTTDGYDGDVANPEKFKTTQDLRTWALALQPTPPPTPTPVPEDDMPQQLTGVVAPGDSPTVVLPPCGIAWSAYTNRKLHLGFDQIGNSAATAQVRVWLHDGTAWAPPPEADQKTGIVSVPAAGGRVDLTMTNAAQKVSLRTASTGVSYAIESW
jgi:GH25 family lysozyme M1 (1,4-beta-N-acetylmuramidase)